MEKIIADKKRLVDSFGRERIFTGINVCDKGMYNPETGKREYRTVWGEGTAKKLRQTGIDLIRLGFVWDAIEPEMGKYNDAYIDELKKILDECEAEGIYVYLDMHQDLYAGFGDGEGDGAPDWACMTNGHKFKKAKIVWAEGYFFSKAVHSSFDNFWNNADLNGKGVQDRFFDMWKYVISKLGDHNAVMGFDMLNEPFPGTDGGKVIRKIAKGLISTTLFDKAISVSTLLKKAVKNETRHEVLDLYGGRELRLATSPADEIIKKFDTGSYSKFINKATEAVRDSGSDKIVLMENSYYSNLGIPYSCPHPTVKGEKDGNIVFAPHAYDFMVDTPEYKYASNERIKAIFDEHKRSQERLGVPVIVGEWCGYTEGNEWFHHAKFLLDLFDSNKWSYTYWINFHGFENWENGKYAVESELFRDVVIRPHPIAVTGEIESYRQDRENNSFELCYNQEGDFDVPTEIYLPYEPKSVVTDGEYEFDKIDGGDAVILKVKTAPGKQKISVQL